VKELRLFSSAFFPWLRLPRAKWVVRRFRRLTNVMLAVDFGHGVSTDCKTKLKKHGQRSHAGAACPADNL